MPARWILIVAVLAIAPEAARAQPWANKDPKAEESLNSLLKSNVDAGGLDQSADPKAKAVLWKIVDPAKLAVSLGTESTKISDAVVNAGVLRWRDDAVNRPFWTQYLRTLATATKRPRDAGFADLFEGVAASGDSATAKRAHELYTHASLNFAKAKDDAWSAAAEVEVGNMALAAERFSDANTAYGRAADLYGRSLGADHPLTASAVMSRGNVAFRQQKNAEAAKFYGDALKMLGADDGPNAAIIASYLQNLANAQIALQNFAAAKTAVDRGLAIIQKAEGEQSFRQLPFLEVLGQIYMSRGERERARDVASKSLELARAAYGKNSVATVRYVTALGDRERSAGNATAALELHQFALKIVKEQPQADETEIADLHSSIGEDFEALAKLDLAAAEYVRALETYRRGKTRRDRVGEIFTLQQMAELTGKRGKIAESKIQYRESINAAEKLLGPSHGFLIGLKRKFALYLAGIGAYTDAAAELRAARKLIDKAEKGLEWADVTNNLAMALEMANDISEAEREVQAAIEIYRREQHPNLTSAYTTLASIHRKRENYAEAARFHRLALDIQTKASGPDDDTALVLRSMIALDEQNAGRYTEAEQLLQEVAEIRKKRYGPDHRDYLKTLLDIADVQRQMGRLADAAANFERVLEAKQGSGLLLWERVRILTGLARIHEARRDHKRASGLLDDARKLLADSDATESDMYALVLSESAELARKRGDTKTTEHRLMEAVDVHRKLKNVAQGPALLAIQRLADLRVDAGDYPAALKWIEEGLAALAANRTVDGFAWKVSPRTADLLILKAEVQLRSDKSPAARKAAHELLNLANAITDRLRFDERTTTESKAALIGDVQAEAIVLNLAICELLAEAEPAGNWKVAAYRVAEEGRARVFLEQLGRRRSEVAGGLPADIAAREKANGLELDRLRRDLEAIEGAPFDRRDPERFAELQKAMNANTTTSEEIQAIIARDHPRVAALRRPYPCSVDEARATLGKNEAAVIFCCRKKVSYAVVLQPRGVKGSGVDPYDWAPFILIGASE